jgi:branched-chain amino acid transport system permease protein
VKSLLRNAFFAPVVFICLLLAVDSLLGAYLNPYFLRVLVNAGIAAILALSLNLVSGCAGQFSLGHAGFMAVGAYVSVALTTVAFPHTWLSTGLGVGGACLVGGLAAGIAGYFVGLPSARLRGDYLAIVTLGFSEIIRVLFLNLEWFGRARGISGIPKESTFFWVYLWLAVTFMALWRLMHSSRGRAILALRDNEIAAETMGINVAHYKIVSFVISSFFAGVAGALYAHYQGFIDPQSFDFSRSVMFVIMVVLGGMGSLSGSVLGAFVLTILPESLRVFEEYRLILFPLILICLMIVRPQGILGSREIWEWGRKK